ncbi:hypothetical protein JAB9_24050 [Janthinobacterium sp. HH107]|nr:hypothetical protein JAB9_24050 [Janthinobacterium sp. HH107]
MQQIVLLRFGARPLLLEQGTDLRAGQTDDDQGIAERDNCLVLTHIRHQVGTRFQVLADAAIVHQADLRVGSACAEQGAVGHQVAQRGSAAALGAAADAGHGDGGHGARQFGRAALLDRFQVGCHCRVRLIHAWQHDDVLRAGIDQGIFDGIDLELDARQHVSAHLCLRYQPALDAAQIALVRMAADDQLDGRVEALDHVDHFALQVAAVGLVDGFLRLAALVQQHDEHAHALRTQLRQGGVDGVRFIAELQAGNAGGRHHGRRIFQHGADQAHLDAMRLFDAVGGQQGLARLRVDDIGRHIGIAGALEVGRELAGLVGARGLATAALLAQQFRLALVKFMVADGAGFHAQHVHGDDARFVRPQRRHGGAGADQVAIADKNQLRIFAAPRCQCAGQGIDAARLHRLAPGIGSARVGEFAAVEVAVEVVQGDQVHFNRAAAYSLWCDSEMAAARQGQNQGRSGDRGA